MEVAGAHAEASPIVMRVGGASLAASAAMPVARPRYPGEFVLRVARDPLEVFVAVAREYGDIVRIPMGPQGFVLVAHPELAREVLVNQQKTFVRGYAHRGLSLLLGEGLLTSQGDFHRKQRRLAQPAFHAQRLHGYAEVMVDHARRCDARWSAAEGASVDMHAEMMGLTLGIVGETLFGAEMEAQTAAVAEALGDALAIGPAALVPFGNLLLQLPTPVARRLRRAKSRLDAVVTAMIAERRAGRGRDRTDLLSILMDATLAAEPDADVMSDQQLRDEVMTMFVAGYETTATAMSWTWYLLGRHADVSARLRAELDTVLGVGPAARVPTFDDLAELRYTRAVLAESMRLYPPAYSVVRVCTERTRLGGHVIEPGWSVATSSYLAHHDPRWWPDPERFDPERWLGPDHSRRKMTYFPFGAGTRICIGEPFTWTETVLVLATLAHRWAPAPASASDVAPRGSITLRPSGPIPMRLRRAP